QTWDEALDAIGPDDPPRHVARFGPKFDAQGVLAGSKDANKCIGYLTKYLTKQVAECHVPETDAQRAHADRLAEALRYEPCSPTCATRAATPGPRSPRPTPTTCRPNAGCCTSSPTGPVGKQRSMRPDEKPATKTAIFRQLMGERRDGGRR